MSKYDLTATDAERMLIERIDFVMSDAPHRDRHQAFLANREPILELLRSLRDRAAIPAHRVSYWHDPAYNPGRRKESRQQMFSRNGNVGDEVYTHPGFLKHLRYILFGASLPETVIAAFEEKVGNPEWVSYGDALELGKFARSLARRFGLPADEASEEFFKLSLDIGLSVDVASRIRESVRTMR